ncbi:GTPase-activating Rap/Ran-GAP domain-like protein 3 [Hermetia illucens]|uniref:GTPase-activating Rap/Ran-GAP domain-like protein 3 n=1 Tax=Hermetia illucens TaxID=343691 RepID=UPI0018CBFD69|nr:GTPase-activating Rap/Ran-GAP domain-like protein 3 [Hermetia illucens]
MYSLVYPKTMLCFNLKLATFFRTHRDESVRDRSQSVCTTSTRTPPPNKDIGALRVLQRRASSVISSATELISRRGVFSRRHYGSVDQLPQSELDGYDPNCRRFRLENGESLAEKDEVFGSPSTPILENPEHQTRWYFKYFLGKLHQNYVGLDSDKNPYFLSIVSQDSATKSTPLYRAILFRNKGTQKIALPYNPHQKLTVKQILGHFPGMDASAKNPKELFSADIQKDLLLLEEQEGSVNFKFGVVYMKAGQVCDDEMLSNETASEAFEEFLSILGEKIRLKGWERFRGGLDVKGDMTGKYSIYTLYEGHEIMFHVSTLLPFSRDNKQQVERKRHIGNDIVNIVFIESDPENCNPIDFDPNCIKSQFTHIFAVVSKSNCSYRLAIFCDETVPPFGPTLPNPPEFSNISMFRDFLLVKLINGEKATFQTPTFSRKRERTLEMLIKDLYEEYVHDNKLNMLNRRAFSEVLYDAPRTSKLKEDARQIEFVRIGQALKLEAIVRGDAPTSLASASPCTLFKRPPWEPQCFYPTFQHRGTLAGDSFGNDKLFVATDDGIFLVREDQSHQLVFDKTFYVKQLSVIEDHGLLLIRGGSMTNRDGHRLHVFRLREFTEDSIRVRSRVEVKERRIDRTRSCHLFSTSNVSGGHLRIAVAVGKKILLFQWKHTAAWASWCPENDTETVDGFIFLKEVSLHDVPTIVTLLEGPTNTNTGGLMCVGFKHHFEIVCDQSGAATKLHEVETSKRNHAQLINAVELCDGQETELLLCYNHTCHFQKITEEVNTTEFDFHWNTSPSSIVCAFPYIIAFTSDTMEIRLLVNGNLVYTAIMPELQLITSKRDIYFVTTAPEFITKDFHIKGLNSENNTERKSIADPLSNEELLKIRHKINSAQDQEQSAQTGGTPMPINQEHELQCLLTIPSRHEGIPSIQRARSLQKPKTISEDQKRHISKSNSCGDSYSNEKDCSIEPGVPPNTPKLSSKGDSPVSPTKRTPSKYRNPFVTQSEVNCSSPDRVKPLRIYRIPLANLTGAHSQFHAHTASNPTKNTSKIQNIKIEEDHSEVDDSLVDNKDESEKLIVSDAVDNITCNYCASLSLFS